MSRTGATLAASIAALVLSAVGCGGNNSAASGWGKGVGGSSGSSGGGSTSGGGTSSSGSSGGTESDACSGAQTGSSSGSSGSDDGGSDAGGDDAGSDDAGSDAGGSSEAPETSTGAGSCEAGNDPLKTGNAQHDAYDCMLLSLAKMYGDPDPMMAKAQMQVESGFNVLATSPDSPCGDPSGWTDAESKSFGLIQVTPACGEENGALLPNGQPNMDKDMSSSLWATSVYNPALNLDAGFQSIAGALHDLQQTYPGCTSAQYVEMSAGAFNSGESAVTGCNTYDSRAQGYVDAVLPNYHQFAAAAGWPDPY
jgi:hypothetical protein